jgi:ATP-dependent RNA helicase RhlE
VQATPEASTAEFVSQEVFYVERKEKQSVLTQFLMGQDRKKTLVFSRTKRGADKIARRLLRDGIHAVSIHGDKSQAKRKAVMKQFSSRRPPVLVATDLAARGLDFSGISHVINYDLPNTPEIYVHRIGRTARAGASGKAITFCASDERLQLRQIERLTGESVPVKKVPILSQELRAMTKKPEPIEPDQVGNQEQGEGKKRAGQGGHGGSGKKNSNRKMKARRGSGAGSSKRRKNTKRSGKKIKAVKRTAVAS